MKRLILSGAMVVMLVVSCPGPYRGPWAAPPEPPWGVPGPGTPPPWGVPERGIERGGPPEEQREGDRERTGRKEPRSHNHKRVHKDQGGEERDRAAPERGHEEGDKAAQERNE